MTDVPFTSKAVASFLFVCALAGSVGAVIVDRLLNRRHP